MGYYISPRFLDKIAVHITKNFLDLPQVRVPLILGIHGRKGEGKSFQCELVFQKMGIEVVHMSAGELESPDAGDPARLLRLRYREAAELIKVRGKMAVLMINDLDAGAGRFDATTQYTVNTQLVNGTLMNIADNPTNVQLPGSYDPKPLHRVPILVTGNDFSTLYEPLIRDGRMEKFYWEPDREDKIGIVGGIFSEDGFSRSEIEQFVDTFLDQSIDFFGALRARIYDEQVRDFIHKIGVEKVSARVANSKEPLTFAKPNFNLARLIEFGNLMVQEQDRVRNSRLAREYNRVLNTPVQASSAPMTPPPQVIQTPAPTAPPPPVQTSPSNGQVTQISPEIHEQLQQLKTSGYRIGIEYVDERRFRTNSWQNCASFTADQDSEVKRAIESCIAEHQGDYVRLVGIDPKAKRRVLETIIHRPGKS
jgi:ribulose bisphosphate carboxylase small subunit